jgi:hypothetical protein
VGHLIRSNAGWKLGLEAQVAQTTGKRYVDGGDRSAAVAAATASTPHLIIFLHRLAGVGNSGLQGASK